MRRLWALAAAAALVMLVASPAAADERKLSGSLTLAGPGFGLTKRECHGYDLGGGYDDIDRGAQVRVRNGDGKTIAVGSLGRGVQTSGELADCRFPFSVKVPDDEDFYSIEVSHRGELTYSRKKLDKMHWKVALTLGS